MFYSLGCMVGCVRSSPKKSYLREFIGAVFLLCYCWSLGTEKKIGFLKLKGESVIKLLKLSFGTQMAASSSLLYDDEPLEHAWSLLRSFLVSTFSADEEFWLSPVEWLVVLLSLCLTSSRPVIIEALADEIISSFPPTRSLTNWFV